MIEKMHEPHTENAVAISYVGKNGLGQQTTRKYATRQEALDAIERKTKREMGRRKASGPLPQMWTQSVK